MSSLRAFSLFLLSLSVLAFSNFSHWAVGQEVEQSPTAAEREAVRQLVAAGASIQIDGEFHVATVSFTAFPRGSQQPPVGKIDLKPLTKLPHLTTLTISGVGANDDDVQILGELKSLTRLSVRATQISDAGIAKLQELLPGCAISHSTAFGARPSNSTSGFSSRGQSSPSAAPGFGNGFPPTNVVSYGAGLSSSGLNPATTLLGQIELETTQTELGLSDEQIRSLAAVVSKFGSYSDVLRAHFEKLREKSSPTEREELVAKLRQIVADRERDSGAAIAGILKPEELARIKQLNLQAQRGFPLAQSETMAALKLSDEQTQKIIELSRRRGGFGGTSQSSRLSTSDTREQMEAVLTDEQKAEWQKMIGAPRKFSDPAPIPADGEVAGSRLGRYAGFCFAVLDSDQNGALIEVEWQANNDIRRGFEATGIELKLPASIEQFIPLYVQMVAKAREMPSRFRSSTGGFTRGQRPEPESSVTPAGTPKPSDSK